jgi:putative selenate reductase molybdopterin-binding subunit
MSSTGTSVVGKSVEKIDAMGLALGAHAFADDFHAKGLLYARVLTSPHAHARIARIDASRARALPGVAHVLTPENSPRVIHTTAGQGFPEPSPYDRVLFDWKVRHVGDLAAAVAAETEDLAMEAVNTIKVDYEPLPAVFDPLEALSEGAPVIHDEPEARAVIPVAYDPRQNLAAQVEFSFGDVDGCWANGEHTFEATYRVHRASHCAIEPHVVIAFLDPDNRLIIRTSTQVPFHARRIVAVVLGIPAGRIRVIKPRIGGAFGGKQEVFLEQIAGLLCLRTGRPVRLQLTREEVFITARTRHPQTLVLRSAVTGEGMVTMLDLDTVLDTGGYGSHGLTVATNTGSKVLPLVNKVKAVRFRARTAYTNLPVSGAYRGYGATQGAFALNVHMDEMARALQMDPVTLWKKNHIREGESSPVFEALGEGTAGVPMVIQSCGLDRCIAEGSRAIRWEEKPTQVAAKRIARGRGMAVLMQGSSIPRVDMASASLKLNDDGSVNLLVGATDLGTGSDTVLAQIAAETLGLSVEKVIVYSSDTDLTPFDTGAYASSTTYLSGEAVRRAANDLARRIRDVAGKMLQQDPEEFHLHGGAVRGTGRDVSLADVALRSLYQEEQEQLTGFASAWSHQSPPPFAAHFAEVTVDRYVGTITVTRYVAAVDCGVAVNPTLAEGQIQGAVVNGIGYALFEEYFMDEQGRMKNPSLIGYRIPCTLDLQEIETILVTSYEPSGPYGAKSISEICINGPLPAISNAVFDAVGIRLREAPFTADRVFAALSAAE